MSPQPNYTLYDSMGVISYTCQTWRDCNLWFYWGTRTQSSLMDMNLHETSISPVTWISMETLCIMLLLSLNTWNRKQPKKKKKKKRYFLILMFDLPIERKVSFCHHIKRYRQSKPIYTYAGAGGVECARASFKPSGECFYCRGSLSLSQYVPSLEIKPLFLNSTPN